MKNLNIKSWWAAGALVLLPAVVWGSTASTGSGSVQNLGQVAQGVTNSFAGIASLILGVCAVAGLGFAAAAIFKFKAHKDNPQSTPLGQPLALLAIAAMLLWIPFLLQSAGQTLTGGAGAGNQSDLQGSVPSWVSGGTP